MDIADLGAGGAGFLSVGLLAAFDEAGIGGEVLDGGKAGDVTDLVEEGEAKDEGNTLVGAEVGQPVPAEDALGPDDQIVTVGSDGL